jgi:hypothetical protein
MDDIVAVKVRDSKAGAHYFITWGRIFDRVDSKGLESMVTRHAPKFGIKRPMSATVCDSLRDASKARYFHEALFHISQEKIPFGTRTYGSWCAKMKREMLAGRQLFYCGTPKKNA